MFEQIKKKIFLSKTKKHILQGMNCNKVLHNFEINHTPRKKLN